MTKVSKNNTPILSVVILNYNAGKYLENLFDSLIKSNLSDQVEVILADNASTDNSFTNIKNHHCSHPKINFIFRNNKLNNGFSWGNNQGLSSSDPKSKYVLFLNPDTTVESNTLQGMINYFESNSFVDAATCFVKLAVTGQLQPECHRGFPTPWNTFCHFFGFGLPKLFPQSKLLNGYFLGHLDYTQVQEIDCCVGAFLMIKRSVGDEIKWWNESYFMYGEDLDFCYQIKKHGYRLYFVPSFKIVHYQGVSSGIKKTKSAASRNTKIRSAKATTNAMRIFYKNNLINNYPMIFRPIIYFGIDFLEFYRVFKARFL